MDIPRSLPKSWHKVCVGSERLAWEIIKLLQQGKHGPPKGTSGTIPMCYPYCPQLLNKQPVVGLCMIRSSTEALG